MKESKKQRYSLKLLSLWREIFLAFLLSFISFHAAQAAIWTGSSSSDWFTMSNWDTGALPTSGTFVYIGTATNAPVISGAAANGNYVNIGYTTSGTLTISGAGTLTSANASYLGATAGATGTVTVTGAGSSWAAGTALTVASSANGALTISNGGSVTTTTTTTLGNLAGLTGTVTVKGTGSTWGAGDVLYVGNYGNGYLSIEDGAVASGNNVQLGRYADSIGQATITGAGTEWNNAGFIYVGASGNGSLLISQSATVTAASADIGYAVGSTGTATVTTNGVWNIGGILNVGNRGQGTLTISSGGIVKDNSARVGYYAGYTNTVTVTGAGSLWQNTAQTQIGDSGTAIVNILEGGELSDSYGVIGYGTTGVGTVTISGSGSVWNNSSYAMIGRSGTGTLIVENGGVVNSTDGEVGRNATGVGYVTVTGAGSKWLMSGLFRVGYLGVADVTVSSGGYIRNTGTGYVGFGSGGIDGKITVTGSGSIWENQKALYIGYASPGTVTVADSGSVTAPSIVVGSQSGGNGTLILQSGGTITPTSGTLTLASVAGSTGKLVIGSASGTAATGAGLLSAGTVAFGAGTGSILFNHTSAGYDFSKTITGAGTITALAGTTYLTGNLAGYTGSILVDGSAGLRVGNSFTGNLYVSQSGTSGALTISDGDDVYDANGYVGYNAGASGSATVTGAGSTWINSSSLIIGNSGTGSLNISSGGSVSGATVSLGANASGNGTVTVMDSGSSLSATTLNIGAGGNGTLTVSGGADVTSGPTYIAWDKNGSVSVTGAGSTLTSDNIFYVGINATGVGTLSIENGGVVSNDSIGVVGYYAGAKGTVSVTGSGSVWTNNAALTVGRAGTGTLTISNSGSVSATSLIVGEQSGSNGTLVLSEGGVVTPASGTLTLASQAGSVGQLVFGSASGTAASAVGVLNATTVSFGAGTGSILFNHTDSNYDFSKTVTGSGTITALAGTTYLSGDLSGFTGTAVSTGNAALYITGTYGGNLSVADNASLTVDSAIAGTVTVGSDGILNGTGTLGGLTVSNGGTVAPGHSIGTLNVSGDVNFAAGSTYEVEVNAAGQSDLIVATGAATISGGAVSVIAEPGGTYGTNTTYTILTAAGGVTGSFSSVSLSAPFLDGAVSMSYDSTNVYVTLTRNGTSFDSWTTATTPNQKAVASAIEAMGSGASLYNIIAGQPDALSAQSAFRSLTGELHADVKGSLAQGASFFSDIVAERTGAIVAAWEEEGGLKSCRGLWTQSYGDWQNAEGDGRNARNFSHEVKGIVFGGDGSPFADSDLRLGMVFGYERSDYDLTVDPENKGQGTADHYRIGAYGSKGVGPFSLRAGAHYGFHSIRTDRFVRFAGYASSQKADYNAQSFGGFGEMALSMNPMATLRLEPFAGLSYGVAAVSSFVETGGVGALRSARDTSGQGATTLGIRAQKKIDLSWGTGDEGRLGQGVWKAQLGWKHLLGRAAPEGRYSFAGSRSFETTGAEMSRESLIANMGFGYEVNERLSFDLSYVGSHAGDSSSNAVRGGLSWRW